MTEEKHKVKSALHTTQSISLLDVQMRDKLNKEAYRELRWYGERGGFILIVVDKGQEVNYKHPLNQKEREELYRPKGAVTNHIKTSQKLRDRTKTDWIKKLEKPLKVADVVFEVVGLFIPM